MRILRLGVALVIVAGLDAAAPAQPASTNQQLTSSPAPRTDHALGFYDLRLRRVVLVGGTGDPKQGDRDKVWSWSGTQWEPVTEAGPPGRVNAGAAYDAGRGKAVVAGGSRKAMDGAACRFGRIYMVTINVFWSRPQSYYDSAPWRGTWEFDGGAFMNQASHYVDLVDWLIGPVESVQAYVATLARNIQVEDTATVGVRWRSGALGSVNVTMLTYPKNLEGSITIIGETGTVRVGGVAVNEIQHWEFDEPEPEDEQVKAASYETTSVYGFGHPLYYDNVDQGAARRGGARDRRTRGPALARVADRQLPVGARRPPRGAAAGVLSMSDYKVHPSADRRRGRDHRRRHAHLALGARRRRRP